MYQTKFNLLNHNKKEKLIVSSSVRNIFSQSNTVLNFQTAGNIIDISRNVYKENPYPIYWTQIHKMMQGITDWRARVGTFTTPWNAPSNPLYRMPELKFINDSLSDLMDQRAVELYNEAKRSNKKIAVMWSGGIDSTSVLVALLKNIPTHEHGMIEVVCNSHSIFENPQFFIKYIAGKLKTQSSMLILVTNSFLDNYILIHGDPADCLFGPSISRMQYAIRNNLHHTPWQKNMDIIKQPLINILSHKENFNRIAIPNEYRNKEDINEFSKNCVEWFCEKVSKNIIENKQEKYLTTITDWYWWTYFNFKWEFSCQRPFLYNNSGESISFEKQQEWAKNTFFNTDKFQQWSYSNLKTLIPKSDMTQHKILIKKYIYEYSKIKEYYLYKNKIAGLQPALKMKLPQQVYNELWQPITGIIHYYDKILSEYTG
jgi:hypothetical protein